ncbi:uncharacterized protein LOC126969089 isoform X2 [Leptidea sinapis]|nr:uncharacterized protein LOC126969089 isoform X2 [Leptidea sinapis]
MAIGDHVKDAELDLETGMLVEVCEDNILLGTDGAGGAVAMGSPPWQLLQAANYNRDDQIHLYKEFILLVYPALFMSVNIFSQFMLDLGWQRTQCYSLYRSADVSSRGGLSFLNLLLWSAALEPSTQHIGPPAEIRCRYIFRYFDGNHDQKLEYVEFKELVAAARAAREMPVDALNVSRDADNCIRQLGLQPNAQVPLAEFLRAVAELWLRGTSSLLRSPKSVTGYLMDLHGRENEANAATASKIMNSYGTSHPEMQSHTSSATAATTPHSGDFALATSVVRLQHARPPEMLQLVHFSEDVVTPSTIKLVTTSTNSSDKLGETSAPSEVFATISYFAKSIEKPGHRRVSGGGSIALSKMAWKWAEQTEEASFGSLLLRLADAVRPICASEPRLLKLTSPVYAIGDLHGNLPALMSMAASLWPNGTALVPARLLFLGDYVDRGQYGTELMAYLLAAKLQRPEGVLLVRGNHEAREIQKMFSFHDECITKYRDVEGGRIWNAINQVFDVLPLAAVVDDKVFCCHGGIPPPWVCPLISAIDKVPVPLSRPAEQSSIAWELLWNDPVKQNKVTASVALELAANEGFAVNNKRGTGHVFDHVALERFLVANQLSHVIRAHELQQNGFMCQFHGRLISVFSSSNYCGGTNDSGVVLISDNKLRLMRVTTE